MGGQASVLPDPWRSINWGGRQSSVQYLEDYKPQADCQQLRILLHGPAGAGKSSFINSVQSALHGRMSKLAFTKRYTTYKIQKGSSNTFYSFVFSKIMGLDANKGVHVEDVKLALKGHVMDGYQFKPESRLSEKDQFCNKTPTANDKVHVLVYVIPAGTVSHMNNDTVKKIQDIRTEASRLRIPQVVILTKIDEVCPEIKEDLKNVYRVPYLKKMVKKIHDEVGIPMKCIFPVKNYSEGSDHNNDTDVLILDTLKNIISQESV